MGSTEWLDLRLFKKCCHQNNINIFSDTWYNIIKVFKLRLGLSQLSLWHFITYFSKKLYWSTALLAVFLALSQSLRAALFCTPIQFRHWLHDCVLYFYLKDNLFHVSLVFQMVVPSVEGRRFTKKRNKLGIILEVYKGFFYTYNCSHCF